MKHLRGLSVPKLIFLTPLHLAQFTPKGTIVLRVRQTSETDSHLWIQVEVEDSGVGIEENVLPTLFQPFRQAHAGTAREFGGTGLGLVISKNVSLLSLNEAHLIKFSD